MVSKVLYLQRRKELNFRVKFSGTFFLKRARTHCIRKYADVGICRLLAGTLTIVESILARPHELRSKHVDGALVD